MIPRREKESLYQELNRIEKITARYIHFNIKKFQFLNHFQLNAFANCIQKLNFFKSHDKGEAKKIICRICEESIPFNNVDNHVRLCKKNHDMKASGSIDNRFMSLLAAFLRVNKKKDDMVLHYIL